MFDEFHAQPGEPAPERARARDAARRLLEQLLDERDAQIGELQQALAGIAAQHETASVRPEIAALHDRLGRLERRVADQEQAIRRTLTLLIDWIEGDLDQAHAA